MYRIKKSGAWADMTQIRRRSGGGWVQPSTVKRRSGGTWITVWTSYTAIHSAYCSPGTVSNIVQTGAGTRFTPSTTVHASGGTGTYTYTWARHSGNGLITASSPSARTTTFQTYFNNVTESRSAVFRCTISDGVSSAEAFVNVYLYNNANTGGGGEFEP